MYEFFAGIPLVCHVAVGFLTAAAYYLRFANKGVLEEIYRVLVPGGSFGMIWVKLSHSS